MKILLDHNLDRRLKEHLVDHEVSTTYELHWSDLVNGELLVLAEQSGFQVLLTADSNISTQQNIAGRRISVIVLRAYSNRLATHLEMIGPLLEALDSIKLGVFEEVIHPKFSRKD
ncbi:MAG: DUF5615 family PIN-like protein [Blastocatellia bacterium]